MNSVENSYSIKKLKFYPFTPNKKLFIKPDTPISTERFSTNYTNNNINNRYSFKNVIKTFHKDKNFYNNIRTNYYSLLTNPSRMTNKYIIKSLKKDFKKKKVSLFSIIKTPKKKKLMNKDNFIFIPKKEEIRNLHTNLMKKNKISVKLSQEKELKNIVNSNKKIELEKEEIKNKNICVTKEILPLFRREYNNDIFGNKFKEKNIILKEINFVGKKLSFVNVKNIDEIKKDIDINNSQSAKKVKEKESLFEINQISNFPSIFKEKNIIFNLWKKDMMKFCNLTMNTKNQDNQELVKNLFSVYT